MRLLPPGLVIHRWCPRVSEAALMPIGTSRDGKVTHLARAEMVEAFKRMQSEARADSVELFVIWAYRSPVLQEEQFRDAQRRHGKRSGIKWLAPPGFSEHQTGWVLDIGDVNDPHADDNPLFAKTPAFHWLHDNADRFGFELSFPPGNWQGVSYEPWHWRYVRSPEAQRAFHPRGLRAAGVWSRSWLEALRWWLHP